MSELFDTLLTLPVVTVDKTVEQTEEQSTLWNETAVLFHNRCYCVETCLPPEIDEDNIDEKCDQLDPKKAYSCSICDDTFDASEESEDEDSEDETLDIEDPEAISLPVSLNKPVEIEIEENDLDLMTGNEDLEALEKDPDLVNNDDDDEPSNKEIKTLEDLPIIETIEAPKKRGRKSKADKEEIAKKFLASAPLEKKNLVNEPRQQKIVLTKEPLFIQQTIVKDNEETKRNIPTTRYSSLMATIFDSNIDRKPVDKNNDFWNAPKRLQVVLITKKDLQDKAPKLIIE